MARTVQEVMNREVLTLRPDLPIVEARDLLRSFAVGAAPVVDETMRPIGVLSLRDVFDEGGTAQERMSRPALCVSPSTGIDEAARLLARSDMHHLIIVDGGGAAVGVVSTLDLLRALAGVPARHPSTFPHWDEATRTSWTDDWPLDEVAADHAPDAPGVLALLGNGPHRRSVVLWVERCANVRRRVRDLALRDGRGGDQPVLRRALSTHDVYFRAARASADDESARIVAVLRDQLEHVPPPGAT